jgi:flagellar biogenesis protein FliO
MLQSLIATLIVLLAAYWVFRKLIAVFQAARNDLPLISSCGSCSGCASKKTPLVISMNSVPIRLSAKSSDRD